MSLLDLSFENPAENLACDEVLLDLCDEGLLTGALRFWEPAKPFVVLGYSNAGLREVNIDYCREASIPVLRRCSGGGTVLQATGCLNYSVIVRVDWAPELGSISSTNSYILQRLARAFATGLGLEVAIRGQTDLALGSLKFSGNAQRRKRLALLYHGTVLLNMDLELVERTLRMPSRQPDYRAHRGHGEFLTNLGVPPAEIKNAIADVWEAGNGEFKVPIDRVQRLARDKYQTEDWNWKF